MELVGFDDLQARSAYQPIIHKQGDRWIAYVGHHGGTAASTRSPGSREQRHLHHRRHGSEAAEVPLAYSGRSRGRAKPAARRWCGYATAANCRARTRASSTCCARFGNTAHEIWDVTDPAKPDARDRRCQRPRDTHKNWWECDTGIAYLVSGASGLAHRRMTQIYDLSDPAQAGIHPQLRAAGPAAWLDRSGADRTCTARISTGPKGNRVYFGYGTGATASCRSSIARSS